MKAVDFILFNSDYAVFCTNKYAKLKF